MTPPPYDDHFESRQQGWADDEHVERARPPKPQRPSKRKLLLTTLVGVVLLALLMSIIAPVSRPLNPLKQPALILMSADGQPIARRGAYKDVPVDVRKLPKHIGDAFVAIEDRRFYRHPGIDMRGIIRAGVANARAGGIVQGGSTITQQLAKTSYLDNKRTFGRKLRETPIALWLELRLTKSEILSAYLSSVYFGDGVYGLRAAARHYFDKTPEALTLSEAAMLAGLVKAPSRLNPFENADGAGRRALLVLTAMVEAGFITSQQAGSAGRVRVQTDRRSLPVGGYFADWVAPAARATAKRDFGEAVVPTTLDLRVQRAAEGVVGRAMAPHPGVQVALVAMTPDGAIRAMVGGRSYGRSQFNRATQAERQPGSAFKTFVYLAALREGHRLDEVVSDTPITKGRWRPANFNNRYAGRIPLHDAFAASSNVVAVRLAQDVGVGDVAKAARDMGVTSKLGKDATLALGTSETTLLELTAAYASIASGRSPTRPFGVSDPGALGRAMDPKHRAALLQLLRVAVSSGTGRQAALLEPTFGKTGTTQDHRDAIFVGFVEGLVVGVWVGHDDRKPMKGVTGGSLPAQIWRGVMVELGFTPAPDDPAAAAYGYPTGSSGGAGAAWPSVPVGRAPPSAAVEAQVRDAERREERRTSSEARDHDRREGSKERDKDRRERAKDREKEEKGKERD